MPAVEISPVAKQDIEDLGAYIAADSPPVALRFIESVRDTFELHAAFPLLGHVYREHVRVKAVRGFSKYLVFYEPRATGVFIVRILHSARNVPSLLD